MISFYAARPIYAIVCLSPELEAYSMHLFLLLFTFLKMKDYVSRNNISLFLYKLFKILLSFYQIL